MTEQDKAEVRAIFREELEAAFERERRRSEQMAAEAAAKILKAARDYGYTETAAHP